MSIEIDIELIHTTSMARGLTGLTGPLQFLNLFNCLNDKGIITIEGTIHLFPEPALPIGSLMTALGTDMYTQAENIIHNMVARDAIDDIKNLRKIFLQLTLLGVVETAIALPVSINATATNFILDYRPIFSGIHIASIHQ
jgi:hypothetical protein